MGWERGFISANNKAIKNILTKSQITINSGHSMKKTDEAFHSCITLVDWSEMSCSHTYWFSGAAFFQQDSIMKSEANEPKVCTNFQQFSYFSKYKTIVLIYPELNIASMLLAGNPSMVVLSSRNSSLEGHSSIQIVHVLQRQSFSRNIRVLSNISSM